MKLPLTLGLRGRLIVLLLTAFATLAGLLVWHLLRDRDNRINAASAELLVRTRMMAARQNALVERADALLSALSALPEPTDLASAAACSQLLAERLKQEPAFSQIARTRPDGEGICSAVPFAGNRNIFDRPYFQRTLQVRSTVVSDVVVGRTLGIPIVVFARAVRDAKDRVSGVLFASLGLNWLEREFAKAQLPQGARLSVLDSQGRIILRYPDPDARAGKNVTDSLVVKHHLAIRGEGTLEETGPDGERILVAYSPFLIAESGAHYHLMLGVPKRVIEAPARRDALFGLGVMLAVLFATLGWVIVAGNRLLLQPLLTLSRTATRLKAGDLGARSGLPHGNDEIGRLAATLDETAAAIEDRDTVRKRAEQEIQDLNTSLERRVVERTQQIERTNQELSRLNSELEAFSYSVSHDLRAPLRSMDGFSVVLLEDYGDKLDAEGKDALHRIRAASQHMGQLIDDLLRLSKVTRAELRLKRVDLSAMAHSIAGSSRGDRAGQAVEWAIEDGMTATADTELMRILVQNLLQNALKFTGKTKKAAIRVGSLGRDGQKTFFVADNGAGFDMQHSARLFGAFQRMHHAADFPGTGIGLAIAHRVIQRHGGKIWAEAKEGEGATFLFTIGDLANESSRQQIHPAG